jgi:hypothetical protein
MVLAGSLSAHVQSLMRGLHSPDISALQDGFFLFCICLAS